jgi:hypothetical protein
MKMIRAIHMAVSAFMFLALQISTEKQEAFLGEANIEMSQ